MRKLRAQSEDGSATVEYALLATFIAALAVTAIAVAPRLSFELDLSAPGSHQQQEVAP